MDPMQLKHTSNTSQAALSDVVFFTVFFNLDTDPIKFKYTSNTIQAILSDIFHCFFFF